MESPPISSQKAWKTFAVHIAGKCNTELIGVGGVPTQRCNQNDIKRSDPKYILFLCPQSLARPV